MILNLVLYAIAFVSIFFIIGFATANPSENIPIAIFVFICSVILGSFIIFIRLMTRKIFPNDTKTRTIVIGTLTGAVALAVPFLTMKILNAWGNGIKSRGTSIAFLFLMFVLAFAFVLIVRKKQPR